MPHTRRYIFNTLTVVSLVLLSALQAGCVHQPLHVDKISQRDNLELAISHMRSSAEKQEWNSYWSCFTERGKGMVLQGIGTVMFYGAFASQDAASMARHKGIIDKYEMMDWRNIQHDDIEVFILRLARKYGQRGPALCADVIRLWPDRQLGPRGDAKILELNDTRATVIFNEVKFFFVNVKGKWLCNHMVAELSND